MFPGEERLGIAAKGAFWVAGSVVGLLFLSARLRPIAARSLTWFSHYLASYLSDYKKIDGIVSVEDTPINTMTGEIPADVSSIVALDSLQTRPSTTMQSINSDGFRVCIGFGLVEALAILGLQKNINDFVTIDAIKEAYRESCKRTHPDKTLRDTRAEFQAVSKAYKDISAFLEHKAGRSSADDSDIFGDRHEIFAERVAKWNELLRSLRELYEENQRQIEKLKWQSAELERQDAEIRELSENLSVEQAVLERRAIKAGIAIPVLTQDDIEGYSADRDFFIKRALMARGVDMSTISVEDLDRLRIEIGRYSLIEEDRAGYRADRDYLIKREFIARGLEMSTLSTAELDRLRMESAKIFAPQEELEAAIAAPAPLCLNTKPQYKAELIRRSSLPRFFSEGISSDGVEMWTHSVRKRSLTISIV